MALSFCILPSEIRNEIYGYLWCDVKIHVDVSWILENADRDLRPAIVDSDKTKPSLPRNLVHTAILRTCRQIYSEAIPFLYERICLSHSPWLCLSAREQHRPGYRSPIRHPDLIEHLRLTFNRKVQHLDPQIAEEMIQYFAMANCSLKRLDFGSCSGLEIERSGLGSSLTAPSSNTTTPNKVALCQDVALSARSILVAEGWRCDALVWVDGIEWKIRWWKRFTFFKDWSIWDWSIWPAEIQDPGSTSASISPVELSTPARANDDSSSS